MSEYRLCCNELSFKNFFFFLNARLIYWSDWGTEGRIERAWMDGQHREVIIEDLGWPNGLVIDKAEMKLYWIDAKREVRS